jgi:hypothetical protein
MKNPYKIVWLHNNKGNWSEAKMMKNNMKYWKFESLHNGMDIDNMDPKIELESLLKDYPLSWWLGQAMSRVKSGTFTIKSAPLLVTIAKWKEMSELQEAQMMTLKKKDSDNSWNLPSTDWLAQQ